MNSAARWTLIVAGHVSVALGVAGLFLPLLPTTPFLLLAAACYVRSSERHHRRLMESRVFGPILRDWEEKRAVPLRAKFTGLAFTWATLLLTAAFLPTPPRPYVLDFGFLPTVMILRVRTLKE